MIKLKKYIVPLLLIILLPQLVNLLCCWMISSRQLHELPTVVYMGDNSALSRKIVTAYDNHDTFAVTIYAETPEAVPVMIQEGKAVFGLVIPRHFTEDMINGKAPKLMTVVDGSQLSAASFTKIASSEILLEIKSELLQEKLRDQFNLTGSQAKSAAASLVFQSRLLGNPTRNYLNFLMPGMMTCLVQVGLAMGAASCVDREKRRTLGTYLGSKALAYTGIGFLSLMVVIGVQILLFKVPMKSGLLPIVVLSLLFSFTVSSAGVMLSTVFWNKVLASQAAAIWFIPSSILSGYTWPLSSMPVFYQKLAWVMPFTHYGEVLRDLLLKGVNGNLTGHCIFLFSSGVLALGFAMIFEQFREKLSERGQRHANPA